MNNKTDNSKQLRKEKQTVTMRAISLLTLFVATLMLMSCAKMGSPDGGWYDETPPRVIGCSPADKGVNVNRRHIYINFDEFIKIDNPSQNVVVSPPQLNQPEIKGQGKRISVELLDSLKPNTTYTIDFSSAISDNNEGNPMGSYTYSFSTGDHIDTLEVSGYVVEASNLEPVKGILVGLYDSISNDYFKKKPMLRVSKTDASGHFTIKGVAPGTYRIYALQDADGDFVFSQKSEMVAFQHERVVPSFKEDTRQDTTWLDSLHIASIKTVPYTHFLPDNICLRAFNEVMTDRYYLKAERKEADHFTLFYTYGDSILPSITGLNFNANNAFIIEPTEHKDTITYWLRDTTLVNQDTLTMALTHHITDTLGTLQLQTDTIKIISKEPYAKRTKDLKKKMEQWQKEQDKLKKRGEPYDTLMRPEPLKINMAPLGEMDPDQNIWITAKKPLNDVDTAHIHLYSHQPADSLWYAEPYRIDRKDSQTFVLKAAWKPEMEYSLEIDSAAFQSIYGQASIAIKQGVRVRSLDKYATLLMTLQGMEGKPVIAQLLDGSDQVVKEATTHNGQAEFFYLKAGKYYMRMILDENQNGKWDTGNYDADRQPEKVYYYPETIECRAKWDLTLTWDPNARPFNKQKPEQITKQKGEKAKSIKHRNEERAKKLGIEYIPNNNL